MDSSIYIISHKPFYNRLQKGYNLIQVGTGPSFADLRDNTYDSIADLNKYYCELTAQYWIWKNRPSDKVGFVHYRRFFANPDRSYIASAQYLYNILDKYEVVLPDPELVLKGNIGTIFGKLHDPLILQRTREIISGQCPEYLGAFDRIMKLHNISYYNMFVMQWRYFDEYMSWLFPILDGCFNLIDSSSYDSYNQRYIGFLAERLLNVWIEYRKPRYCYLPVLRTDGYEYSLSEKLKLCYSDFNARKYRPVLDSR